MKMSQLDSLLEEIAKKHLFVETLESRNMDSLDFYDVSVRGIRAALFEAFEAGFNSKDDRD